jgi:hypothetical protein
LTANTILATEGNIDKLIHGGERTGGHFSIRAHYAMAEGEGAVKFVLCTPQSASHAVYLLLVVTPAGPFCRLAQYLDRNKAGGRNTLPGKLYEFEYSADILYSKFLIQQND